MRTSVIIVAAVFTTVNVACAAVVSYKSPRVPTVAQNCAEYSSALKNLHDKFGEKPTWTGKEKAGVMMLTENTLSGTWTLLLITKKGDAILACQVDDGVASQDVM